MTGGKHCGLISACFGSSLRRWTATVGQSHFHPQLPPFTTSTLPVPSVNHVPRERLKLLLEDSWVKRAQSRYWLRLELSCLCLKKNIFISSSGLSSSNNPEVVCWSGISLEIFQGVERPYRGSGNKPREVLLFLMCCWSPTQPPPPLTVAPPTLQLVLIILSVQQHTHALSPQTQRRHHHTYTLQQNRHK